MTQSTLKFTNLIMSKHGLHGTAGVQVDMARVYRQFVFLTQAAGV